MVATLTATEPASVPRRLTAEELCRLHAAQVCRFAALMSPGGHDAEDLAQEALLRAVRSLDRFDAARGPVDAWLWRIVANAAKDAASRRQRLRDIAVRIGLETPRESESVEDAVLTNLRNEDLRSQLSKLPLRDRTLIALRFGAGLETKEVGAAVGLNPESASRAMRRALARLRARLEEA
jgi:RNA polymerase sigma-70 factor, ECF subfamily